MENVAIKCKSKEHGKKIIEWFRTQGVDTYYYTGDNINTYYYAVDNIITCSQFLPENYTVIELPEYPKVMIVSNYPDFKQKYKRVVFIEKQGKFIAWQDAETLEEAETQVDTFTWNYAKDLPEINPQKELLLTKANELIAKAEELKKEANKL